MPKFIDTLIIPSLPKITVENQTNDISVSLRDSVGNLIYLHPLASTTLYGNFIIEKTEWASPGSSGQWAFGSGQSYMIALSRNQKFENLNVDFDINTIKDWYIIPLKNATLTFVKT